MQTRYLSLPDAGMHTDQRRNKHGMRIIRHQPGVSDYLILCALPLVHDVLCMLCRHARGYCLGIYYTCMLWSLGSYSYLLHLLILPMQGIYIPILKVAPIAEVMLSDPPAKYRTSYTLQRRATIRAVISCDMHPKSHDTQVSLLV